MKSSKWTVKQILLQSKALLKPKPYCDVSARKNHAFKACMAVRDHLNITLVNCSRFYLGAIHELR
jgi:hypothetical protein